MINFIELDLTAVKIGEGEQELVNQTEIVASEAAHFKEVLALIQADHYQDVYPLVQSFKFVNWRAVKKISR